MDDLPRDWDNPEWNKHEKVHGWRNYVSPAIEGEWQNFTDDQKKMLAYAFKCWADMEEWD